VLKNSRLTQKPLFEILKGHQEQIFHLKTRVFVQQSESFKDVSYVSQWLLGNAFFFRLRADLKMPLFPAVCQR